MNRLMENNECLPSLAVALLLTSRRPLTKVVAGTCCLTASTIVEKIAPHASPAP